MDKIAQETIHAGLSLGARIVLGGIAVLCGVVSILCAQSADRPIPASLFGAFCICIAIACICRGRIRQIAASLIGLALFAVGIGYLVSEISAGIWISGRHSQPSVLNAVFFLVFIGLPGGAYAYNTQLGFRPRPPQNTDQDA